MEHLHPTTYPESLKATLSCYRIASIDSLSGPSGFPALAAQMWYKETKQLPPIPPQPMVQIPYFIPNDKSAKRSETMLAGEKIACFIVGGEKRLCLPQILTSVLREYSIAEINQACADLHIYCSRCLPDQLEILKVLGILPMNTAQCGLITKTDAERLVALLMDQHEPVKSFKDKLPKDIDPEGGFQVYHECFGRAYGKFYPKAYISPVAKCIMCEDCGCMYNPQRFIAHSDSSFEKRTCHWGFDPENWRHYLLLPKDLEGARREENQNVLDQMKARFDQPRYDLTGPQPPPIRYTGSPPTPSKRRYDSEQESPIRKKIKEEDGKVFEPNLRPHPYASLQYGVAGAVRHSAFRPWSPVLSTMPGPGPGDISAIQDLSHLKGLLPIAFDRRGFPQYIQNGRPLVLSSRASDFSLPAPADSRATAGAGPPPLIERKISDENDKLESAKPKLKSPPATASEKDRNNNHDHLQTQSRGHTMVKVDLTRTRSLERSPRECPQNLSTSPSSRPTKVAEVSPRARSGPRHPTNSQPNRSTHSQSSNNNNTLKDLQPEYEITRPISRSREAAATAMLELKSSGLYRPGPPPRAVSPPHSSAPSDPPRKLPPTPIAPKSTPSVVPLDSACQQYKWTIGGQNYIVSSAGVKSLEMLQHFVEAECGSEAGRGRLMHELVKMKSLFEEKIDIEMRVRRDLESELEHLQKSKREKLHATSEARKQIQQEVEKLRQEHAKRVEDFSKRQESFRRKQEEEKHRNPRDIKERLTDNEFKELQYRIQELEIENDKLKLDLIEEREKRENAEVKLEDATEYSRGRLSFLMESPLSRMVRGVGSAGRKNIEEDRPPPLSPHVTLSSPNGKRITSTQVPTFSAASVATSMSHCQLNGILPTGAASVNGLTHEQSLSSDLEAPKTVVVS